MVIFKVALSFSPETICSYHSFPVVCRIPLLAIHTSSKTPRLLMVARNRTLHPLQVPLVMLFLHSVFSTISPLLLFHCHVNSWHESCPDTWCWPTTSNAQLEATSWCCTQTNHLLLCPRVPTQHQSFKKGTGTSGSKASAPLGSISHTRKQDQLPNSLRYVHLRLHSHQIDM